MVGAPGIQPGATFTGMQVIVSPFLEPKPKLKLSANYRGTEAFRVAFDAWLVDVFGFEEERAIITGNTILISPRGYLKMQEMTSTKADRPNRSP